MLIGREKIDLLLLDVDLPFIDGHKLLQAARENGVDVLAIFISGLPGDEVEVRAFRGRRGRHHPQAGEELGAAGARGERAAGRVAST